ncbi:hypothetical protein C6P45_005025 [Maudiozyma exigua]|uniref:Uncharacterized protein n=1 Tax=Maudiozyma exigua TaxID=34358 RepID=A0A9P7BBB4_MAUEX|nr:hypothetical protein C6P45_005025 [Kazachstania exigua]
MESSNSESKALATKDMVENKIFEEVLKTVCKEFYAYSKLCERELEEIYKTELVKDVITEEETQESTAYFASDGGNKSKLTPTEIFIRKSKIFLKVQHIYRVATNGNTGPVCSHIFLPAVLDYLLALLVTSVNPERTFSQEYLW